MTESQSKIVQPLWKRFFKNRATIAISMLIIGLLVGILVGPKIPIPYPDRGHRFFATADENTHNVLVKILAKNGLEPARAFDAAPTHQTIMDDKTTVIAWFDKGAKVDNAISLPVDNPKAAAEDAAATLRTAGYTATVSEPIPSMPAGTLVRVETNALVESCLIFRLSVFKMPQPTWKTLPPTK
jgi:hypothetical protein